MIDDVQKGPDAENIRAEDEARSKEREPNPNAPADRDHAPAASLYPVGPLATSFAASRSWVVWRLRELTDKHGKSKSKKPPLDPHTGREPPRGSDMSKIRLTLAEARAAAGRHSLSGRLGGIGIDAGVQHDDRDGEQVWSKLGYMDLDNCRDPKSGKIADWARLAVEKFNSYTEVSPSGIGLKIFFLHCVGDGSNSEAKGDGNGEKNRGYELRFGKRYSTVTGRQFESYDKLNSVTPDIVDWVSEKLRPHIVKTTTNTTAGKARPAAKPATNVKPPRSLRGTDKEDWALVADALKVLEDRAHEYDRWIAYGLAIFRRFGERGLSLWDDWSRKAHNYSAADVAKEWKSICKKGGGLTEDDDKAVTVGTIFHDAAEAGWVRPQFDDGRPVIIYDARRPIDAAKAGLTALRELGQPIYQQQGRLIHVVRYGENVDNIETQFRLRRDAEAVVICQMDPILLGAELNQGINWTAPKQTKSGGTKIGAVLLPQRVANTAVVMKGQWPVPELNGIVHSPTLYKGADGELVLLQMPGYDEASGLRYAPNDNFDAIPLAPSRQDAEEALGRLLAPVAGFPFVPDMSDDDEWMPATDEGARPSAHRSVYLSALLTGSIRRDMAAAPLHAFDATSPGTGKSKLAAMVGLILTGRLPASMPWVRAEDEQRKRIVSVAMKGDLVLLFENVMDSSIGGATINTLLTEQVIEDRLLGKSEIIRAKTNLLVLATGNNLVFEGDMTRRAALCKMNAGVERPQDRQFLFDPVAMVGKQRARLATDCLVILLAYIAAGKPLSGKVKVVGSYEDWTIVREALVWLGQPDPADTMKEISAVDPVADSIRQVMGAWWECFGDNPTKLQYAIELAQVANERDYIGDPCQRKLFDALSAVCNNRPPNVVGLGIWFSRYNERIVDGRRFKSGGTTSGRNSTGRLITLAYQAGEPIPDTPKGVLNMSEESRRQIRQDQVENEIDRVAKERKRQALERTIPM